MRGNVTIKDDKFTMPDEMWKSRQSSRRTRLPCPRSRKAQHISVTEHMPITALYIPRP